MKRALIFIALALVVPSLTLGQIRKNTMQEEDVLKLEKEFSQAIVRNDSGAVGRFLADDWIIIDPDGGMIDRASFLGVIESGALTHEMMESDNPRVRIYGNTAIVTALTTSKGKFSGQVFTTQERATDVFVEQNGDGCACFRSSLDLLRSEREPLVPDFESCLVYFWVVASDSWPSHVCCPARLGPPGP